MFEYFYHSIMRKTIIGFGTLFNNIKIKTTNADNEIISELKVPIAYAPMQKFLARLEQSPDLDNPVRMTLPKMSFELVGLTYDSSRKVTTTQSFLVSDRTQKSKMKKVYMPVPYTMEFELNIMAKHNDDALQIVEQILPYFQPSYTLTIDLIDSIGEKRDIPFTLNNITMEDRYDGDFKDRRAIIYSLKFSAKTYLFGPVPKTEAGDIIKKVQVGYFAGDKVASTREITYQTTPVASVNYTNFGVTTTASDMEISTNEFSVVDPNVLSENSYITVDGETMKIIRISDVNVRVERGSYGTKITQHVAGTAIKNITVQDNDLIEVGDNFGFDMSSF
jgi:hypothetical protein